MGTDTDIPPAPGTNNIPSDTMNFNYDDDDNNGGGGHKLENPTNESYNISSKATAVETYGTNDNAYIAHANAEKGDETIIPITRACYIFAACAALNSCNLGYDIGVNPDAGFMLKESMGLSNVQLEFFMGSLNLFAMIGALFAHSISDSFGRRGSFLIAAVSFIFGILIMACAGSYGMLMFGRIFVGLGVGFGLAVDPVYIAEISPAAHRGRLVTWSEFAINIGIVFGFSSGFIFQAVQEDTAWRLMFAMGVIMPTILIICVITVMPESPRWLVSKNREAEAKVILEMIYPLGYDVDMVVEDIKEAIQREVEANDSIGWDKILFPSPAFKRMLLVGIGTAIAQQAVGIDAIQYFLVFILKESGIESRQTQSIVLICLGIVKASVVVLAGFLFDKRGRKPLMFFSLLGMTVALFILSVAFFVNGEKSGISVVALAMYLGFFSVGMGPGAWLIPSEVFSTTIRAKAMSVATFLNRVVGTILSSTFLSIATWLTWGGYFLLMCIICICVALFFYLYLPETKGKSLEDMTMYFAEITGDQSILEAEESLKNRGKRSNVQHSDTELAGVKNGTLT